MDLAKVDLLRERTGMSYELAVALLKEHDGNIVEAIVAYENEYGTKKESYEVKGDDLIEKIRNLIKEGNVTKITVKQNDKVILSLPVNIGIVAALLAPYLAILGGAVAVAAKCTIVVERNTDL